MSQAKNYSSQKTKTDCRTHAQIEESTLARHLLVVSENYTPLRTTPPVCHHTQAWNYNSRSATLQHMELHFPEALSLSPRSRNWRQPGHSDPPLDMAFLARTFGYPACRSVVQLGGRWLQPRVWMGLPDAWGLPSVQQQTRGRTRGNEYQPSNIKRKHKHGWIRRLSTPKGVQVILRRMLKGRKSLSH